jgi:diaminopimelate epimerase
LRVINPDGSEAETSGNGLRIFARYLWDRGLAGEEPILVATPARRVTARVHPGGRLISLDMGKASFFSADIPVRGPAREVLDEVMMVQGETARYSAVTLGNPHRVLLRDSVGPGDAQRLGPLIECEPRFPNRTNVQFVQVVGWSTLKVEIWERGASYTLASGSSSCAAASVAHRLGLVDPEVTVQMAGGTVQVVVSADGSTSLTGSVARVCEGVACMEMFDGLEPAATAPLPGHRVTVGERHDEDPARGK